MEGVPYLTLTAWTGSFLVVHFVCVAAVRKTLNWGDLGLAALGALTASGVVLYSMLFGAILLNALGIPAPPRSLELLNAYIWCGPFAVVLAIFLGGSWKQWSPAIAAIGATPAAAYFALELGALSVGVLWNIGMAGVLGRAAYRSARRSDADLFFDMCWRRGGVGA